MERNYFSRKIVTSLICIFVFLIFQEKIVSVFDDKIVVPFLDIDGSVWISILWLLLIIGSIIYLRNVWLQRKPIQFGLTWISALLLAIYCYYRFFTHRYDYVAFQWTSYIKLTDYILIPGLGLIILFLRNHFRKFSEPVYENNPFLVDIPIVTPNQDAFKRNSFAKALASKIQSRPAMINAGAFALGITGSWGSGKTSFINLVRDAISPENRVIIEFNPWRSAGPHKIVQDFFSQLRSSLAAFDPSLSKSINDYARTLVKIDENEITKFLEGISDFIFESNDDKDEVYKSINASIAKTKKQVIIFIDDLDRLDKREVIEVLRLIRNTANFDNIVFIAGYDKNYLFEAIVDFNPFNHTSFLDKIFQFEFPLPPISANTIRFSMTNALKDYLPSFHSHINNAVNYRGSSGKNFISRVILTQREVIRFLNVFIYEIGQVETAVNFTDFYFIQLIKFKFPTVYQYIADYRDLIFVKDGKQQRLRLESERLYNEEDFIEDQMLNANKESTKSERQRTVFETDLLSKKESALKESDKNLVLEIMEELMKEKTIFYSVNKDPRSFINYENFQYYLNFQILSSDFSTHELEESRLDYGRHKKAVQHWLNREMTSDIQDYLEKIVEFDNWEQWWNHLRIVLMVARSELKASGSHSINYRQIIKLLVYPVINEEKTKIFFETRLKYDEWIYRFFENAKSPYILEGNIIVASLTGEIDLKLKPEDSESINLGYLKKYCATNKVVSNEVFEIWRNCITHETVKWSSPETTEKSNHEIRKFVKMHLNASQLGMYIIQDNPRDEIFSLQKYQWKFYFHEFDQFVHWIHHAPNLQIPVVSIDEFKRFLELVTSSDNRSAKFDFVELKPARYRPLKNA